MGNEVNYRYPFALDYANSEQEEIYQELNALGKHLRTETIRQCVLIAYLMFNKLDLIALCLRAGIDDPLSVKFQSANNGDSKAKLELRWHYKAGFSSMLSTLCEELKLYNVSYRSKYVQALLVLGFRILKGKVDITEGTQTKAPTAKIIETDNCSSEAQNEVYISDESVESQKVAEQSNTNSLEETQKALSNLMKRSN